MSEYKLLVNSRKYTRKLVTENYNKKDTFSNLSLIQKEQYRAILHEYHEQLKGLNSKIQTLKWAEDPDEKALDEEFKNCEAYSSKIIECLVLLNTVAPATIAVQPAEHARTLLKSPVAPLPRFTSAEGEDLIKFFNQFEETVSKYSFPDDDKLLLLKQQVSGQALALLNSLECDKQGYQHAKELLVEALASPDVQRFNTIKALINLKLDDTAEPFEYVSKMRVIQESVKSLKIDVDSFLQYFFWRGLNDSFQSHMIQITNKTKPSLEEINANFFLICERYHELKLKTKCGNAIKLDKRSKEAGYAANVSVNISSRTFKPCSICSKLEGKDATHPIYKCTKFASAREKIEKLKSISGCQKCGNTNHLAGVCQYRFKKKCKFCAGWHFDFLCVKISETNECNKEIAPKKTNSVSKGKIQHGTANNLTVIEAVQSGVTSDSILPTFTCLVENKEVRGLKDGGCQSNFITDDLAKSLKLKVLNPNLNLTVNGINISQKYKTKLVELHARFADKLFTLQALCLPSINIALKLPSLANVVNNLKRKGYELADKRLNENSEAISDIGLILGTKSSFCLPENDVVFGCDETSVYARTPVGVMLKGDVNKLNRDVNTLPSIQSHGVVSTHTVPCDILPAHSEAESTSLFCLHASSNVAAHNSDITFDVVDRKGNVIDSKLDIATSSLEFSCNKYINLDPVTKNESSELDNTLVNYALNNTSRNKEGRLVMPLLWNSKSAHLIGKNRKLSTLILKSNLKRLQKRPNCLKLMNEAIKEQEHAGIVERIDNLEQYLEMHPEHSFLPHMGVFKLDRNTTKSRVVFLSNLCEKDSSKRVTVSHNQAMHCGPSLNQKISSALLQLRFGEKLLCFDVIKAFNNISLNECDQNKLLFLWFRNVDKNDYSIVGYRNLRLSLGLRCSPTLLLLALYKILVIDTAEDSIRL